MYETNVIPFPLIWPVYDVGKSQSNDHLWGFAYCLLIIHLGESVDLSPGDCPLRWAKWVHTHLSVCTAPKRFTIVFENSMAITFVYSGTWRTCWPKEACLYVGSDWLSSSSSQKVARGQLDDFFFLVLVHVCGFNMFLELFTFVMLFKGLSGDKTHYTFGWNYR